MRTSLSVTTWIGILAIFFPTFANAQKSAQIEIGGSTLVVKFASEPTPMFREATLNWITRAARAVTIYYQRFPVEHVEILIRERSGSSIGSGSASGEHGPRIKASLGSDITSAILEDGRTNWLMTHEMVHLALSGVEEQHHWLEEGLATYVEPIARARAGELSVAKVWKDMVEGMPQGQPALNDQGLDNTPTWGRTYWGGAMFCLVADVEIRKQTLNKLGLEDALRAIVAAGGTIDTEWGLAKVIEVGDRATGVSVLRSTYEKMGSAPNPVDLDALWAELGVSQRGGRIIFDDTAPLAAIRKAITQPGQSRSSGP
jgi:hypothetical protein